MEIGGAEPGTFLELLAWAGVRKFARGEHLMHQGEPGDRVLILLRGHVKATFVGAHGPRDGAQLPCRMSSSTCPRWA